MSDRLVIIGAGQAAFALVAKLRALKDERPITILGSEDVLPYQRPPLSKKYLMGEMEFDRLLYRSLDWYRENHVEIIYPMWVEEIDRANKLVRTQDGTEIVYGNLVIATGAEPRKLPENLGGTLKGVLTVRSKADADRLMEEIKPGRKLLVIGGGYIGLEAAAVARQLGLDVCLIEMAERILSRVAAAETAVIMRDIHQHHGVDILEKTGISRLIGNDDGRVVAAELADGSVINVDVVILGIGVTPNDQLARAAGITCTNGIVVDEFGRTSDPDILALGDCCVLPFNGDMVRLESVPNAVDQAEAAALVLTGVDVPYVPKPWFWSDQYDVKLQIAGFNAGYDETILRKGARDGAWSVWYFRAGRLIAVDAINDAKAYVTGKKLLDLGKTADRALLADPDTDLKLLLQ
jgi:3-phenylpropionate/trans-cinnamate dioxygenase ferredoxin reductase subunit